MNEAASNVRPLRALLRGMSGRRVSVMVFTLLAICLLVVLLVFLFEDPHRPAGGPSAPRDLERQTHLGSTSAAGQRDEAGRSRIDSDPGSNAAGPALTPDRAVSMFLDEYLGNGGIEDMWALAQSWEALGEEALPALRRLLADPFGMTLQEHDTMQMLALGVMERMGRAAEAVDLLAGKPEAIRSDTLRRWFVAHADESHWEGYILATGDSSMLLDLPPGRTPSPELISRLRVAGPERGPLDPARIGLVAIAVDQGDSAAIEEVRRAFLSSAVHAAEEASPAYGRWRRLLERLPVGEQANLLNQVAGGPEGPDRQGRIRALLVGMAARLPEGWPDSSEIEQTLEQIAADASAPLAATEARGLINVAQRMRGEASAQDPTGLLDMLRPGVLPDGALLTVLGRSAAGSQNKAWTGALLEWLGEMGRRRFEDLPFPEHVVKDASYSTLADELARLPWGDDPSQRFGREFLDVYLRSRAGARRSDTIERLRGHLNGAGDRDLQEAAEWAGMVDPFQAHEDPHEFSEMFSELLTDGRFRDNPEMVLMGLQGTVRRGRPLLEAMYPTIRALAEDHWDAGVRDRAVRLAMRAAPDEHEALSILSRRHSWNDANHMEEAWEEATTLWRRGRLSLDPLLEHYHAVLSGDAPADVKREAADEVEEVARYIRVEADRESAMKFYHRIQSLPLDERWRRKLQKALWRTAQE